MTMVARSAPTDADEQLVVEARDWTEWPVLASTWSLIARQCERPTVFLTTEFVEIWLSIFGEQLAPKVYVFKTAEARPVAVCVVVRRIERQGPFFLRRLYLNTAGEDERDSPCIEYNQLLCLPGYEQATGAALRRHLVETEAPWDEVHGAGLIDSSSLNALRTSLRETREIDSVKQSYYVDLDDLRGSGADFIDKLASRERTKVRQSLRKYGDIGPLGVDRAGDVSEALRFLDELAALHQATWTSRGRPGAFASSKFYDYHRHLIRRCFALDRIQLLRARAGDTTIGYHYNFVFDGFVHFYQCGYDYTLGERLTPGIALHTLAIRHAFEHGLRGYEFMAGDIEYKRRLATHARQMHWITWQAPTIKMKSFELTRRAGHALRTHTREVRSAVYKSLRGALPSGNEEVS
jgi:hypothetical protein